MPNRVFRLIIVSISALSISCEQPFSPKGQFQQSIVAYCILTTQAQSQLARVNVTYDTEGFDPYAHAVDNPVTDAQVALLQGNQRYPFRDTLITRLDSSRYRSKISAYVLSTTSLQPGLPYTFSVLSPTYGSVSATATLPARCTIGLGGTLVLSEPQSYQYSDVELVLTLSSISKGYVVKFLVVYESPPGSGARIAEEVPVSVDLSTGSAVLQYPKLARLNPTTNPTLNTSFNYSNPVYQYMLRQIIHRYDRIGVRFKSANFYVYQLDANLYDYYNIVNGFRDQYSIRTDLPDFTNVTAGMGVFGAMTVDSSIVPLPDSIRVAP